MLTLSTASLGYFPTVSFDQAYSDRDLRVAADALARRGNWHPARDVLLAAGDQWELKEHRVDYLAKRAVGKPVLREWVEAEPGSGDALTVLSRAETMRAWAARSARSARYVRKSAWLRFFEILAQADDIAARAGELSPYDPTPRVTALRTARGLQVGRHEFDARWENVVSRDPLHRTGHHQALQYLSAKWFGSHQEMFRFARDSAKRAPEGHSLVVLPVFANLEMSMAENGIGNTSARFAMDLAAVRDRWIDVGPVRHPRIVEDHTILAFYLGFLRRRFEAAAQFRAMGRQASTVGWMHFSRLPRQAFLHGRASALRSAGNL